MYVMNKLVVVAREQLCRQINIHFQRTISCVHMKSVTCCVMLAWIKGLFCIAYCKLVYRSIFLAYVQVQLKIVLTIRG